MVKAAFDRSDRNAEPACDLRLPQIPEIAEIQDLLVGIAEAIERFMHDRPRRNAVDAGRQRRLVKRFQRELHALCLCAEIVVAFVPRNAEDPRLEHDFIGERFRAAIRRRQNLLQNVLRIRKISDTEFHKAFQRLHHA